MCCFQLLLNRHVIPLWMVTMEPFLPMAKQVMCVFCSFCFFFLRQK